MLVPKQWLHWGEKSGLKPEIRRWGELSMYHLIGRGRRWRVNCHQKFQISCPIAEFDRWANSLEYETEIPKSESEFREAVHHMLQIVREKNSKKFDNV